MVPGSSKISRLAPVNEIPSPPALVVNNITKYGPSLSLKSCINASRLLTGVDPSSLKYENCNSFMRSSTMLSMDCVCENKTTLCPSCFHCGNN